VLPKVMNCYKKRMEVILCLVQRHLNELNDFERVGSRWRMTPCHQQKRANNGESVSARQARSSHYTANVKCGAQH
jgi:hypothetical protein